MQKTLGVRNFFSLGVIGLTISYFLFIPCQAAAVMRGLSTEELTRESEAVVRGEIEDLEAQWSKDGKIIITIVSLKVDEVIRGVNGTHRLTVEYEGGEIGGLGLRVSDMPSFKKGEKVLLFLKSGLSKKDGTIHRIVGKAQGKYSIGEDHVARKSGFHAAIEEGHIDNHIPVNELIEKIKGVR